MKNAIAKTYAEPNHGDAAARFMGIATALLFGCMFALNMMAY